MADERQRSNGSLTEPHSNGSLTEPHFDDEATLLSARRVVPFHKLTDKTTSKRNLFFGTALVSALVIGIIGGVLYARLEWTAGSKAETTEATSQPILQNEISSSEQDNEIPSVADESKPLAEDKADQKSPDKPRNSSTNLRKSVPLNPPSARRAQREPDEWDYYATDREIRQAERRAARRARREAARETQRSNDLFRIREIFEGSPRP